VAEARSRKRAALEQRATGYCVDNPTSARRGTTLLAKDCTYAKRDTQDSQHCKPDMQCIAERAGKNIHEI